MAHQELLLISKRNYSAYAFRKLLHSNVSLARAKGLYYRQ